MAKKTVKKSVKKTAKKTSKKNLSKSSKKGFNFPLFIQDVKADGKKTKKLHMALAIGVTPTMLSLYIKKKNVPGIEIIGNIANYFKRDFIEYIINKKK